MTRDFRLFLQDELTRRCQHNPRYSLRAFAASLGIGSSDLSKLIRCQRQLTDSMLLRLGKRLGLGPEELETHRAGLADEARLRRKVRTRAGAAADFKQLSLDTFRLVADWHHFVILEVMKLRRYQPRVRWIARQLGLTVTEVNIALQRLVRLGFLEERPDGTWADRAGATSSVNDEYSDVAARRQQRQILEKAITALDEVPITERDQSAMLMAVNTKHLPAAKALIRDFRRQLCALLEEGDEKDRVYYLSVSLFPITPRPSPEEPSHDPT